MRRLGMRRWICWVCLGALLGCAGGQKAGPSGSGGKGKGASSGGSGTTTGAGAGGAQPEGGQAGGGAPEPEGDVKGDLISVTLTASKDLNTFNNQSHTLVLVLYQLTQSSVYAQFLDTPEGKAKLLAGESFDPSVLSRRRVVLQPGETQRIELDRMEGARYLAAVAGYYNVQTQDMSRVLPVVRETSGLPGFKKLKPQLVHLSLGKSGFAQ